MSTMAVSVESFVSCLFELKICLESEQYSALFLVSTWDRDSGTVSSGDCVVHSKAKEHSM